jgi:hypothetical protein
MDRLPAHTGDASNHRGSRRRLGTTAWALDTRTLTPSPTRVPCDLQLLGLATQRNLEVAPLASSDPGPRPLKPVSRSDDAKRACLSPRDDPATRSRASRRSRAPPTHPKHCDHDLSPSSNVQERLYSFSITSIPYEGQRGRPPKRSGEQTVNQLPESASESQNPSALRAGPTRTQGPPLRGYRQRARRRCYCSHLVGR